MPFPSRKGLPRRPRALRGIHFAAALFGALLCLSTPARSSEVPLGESGGIYTVTGQVNRSVAVNFLVDPGSAVVVLPRSVLERLILNGTITQDDIVGISIAELADRSLYETLRLRLRELRVGDNVAYNVIAAASPGLSHALLGQSFLKRFATVTLDNQRRVLILSNPGVGVGAQYPSTPFYGSSQPVSPGAYGQPSYWPRH